MKQFLLLMFLFSIVLQCMADHSEETNIQTPVSAAGTEKMDVLNTVAEIGQYKDAAIKLLYVKDTLRGGFFQVYEGPDLPDGGMVFGDAANRKWLRQTVDARINAMWYGARSYVPGQPDAVNNMVPYFQKALNYIYTHKRFTTLYIPQDKRDFGVYYVMSVIQLRGQVIIEGDGGTGDARTVILATRNTPVFFQPFRAPDNSNTEITLKNLSLGMAESKNGERDSTKHVFESRGRFHLYNINIYYSSGNGIHAEACAIPGNPVFGNCNLSTMQDVQVTACYNGIYLAGCDANKIVMNSINVVGNRRWGIWDNGFLGNTINSMHGAHNGVVSGQSFCVVSYAGKYYVAINTDEKININKKPATEPGFWAEIPPLGAEPWQPGIKYQSGGPVYVSNPNAWSVVYDPYTEAFQPPMRFNSRSMAISGDNAARVWGGINLAILDGKLKMPVGGIVLPSAGQSVEIGKENPYASTPLYAYQAQGMASGLIIDAAGTGAYMKFRNASDQGLDGQVGYTGNDLVFVAGGNAVMYIGKGVGVSPSANKTYSLGNPDMQWKNLWAGNYYAEKINISTNPLQGASAGTGVLSSGSAVINTSSVTSFSKIFLTLTGCNNCGTLYTGPVKPGESFTVTSSNKTDKSSFNWWVIN
ncbi:MAG: hypothetical protein U0V75_14780 [Ferruginibacter sp.]